MMAVLHEMLPVRSNHSFESCVRQQMGVMSGNNIVKYTGGELITTLTS